MSLKSKNSSGHDGISSKLLKTLAQSLCIPICTIINKSLQTGDVPRSMEIAKVIKTDMGNYRRMSLLSKILEQIVHEILYSFFMQTRYTM